MLRVEKPAAHRFDVEAAVGVVGEQVLDAVAVDLHNAHCNARVSCTAAVLRHSAPQSCFYCTFPDMQYVFLKEQTQVTDKSHLF